MKKIFPLFTLLLATHALAVTEQELKENLKHVDHSYSVKASDISNIQIVPSTKVVMDDYGLRKPLFDVTFDFFKTCNDGGIQRTLTYASGKEYGTPQTAVLSYKVFWSMLKNSKQILNTPWDRKFIFNLMIVKAIQQKAM